MGYFENNQVLEAEPIVVKDEEPKDILHIISVVSSPFGQDTRIELAQDFITRMQETEKKHPCILYVIEIIYENQSFRLKLQNPKHLLKIELPNSCILWNKENMINVGVRHFLPSDWKYMAWIDADIEFKDPYWVEETIKTFKDHNADILQLFSYCRFLGRDHLPKTYWFSSMFQYVQKQMGYSTKYFWQSGFAWACTHSAFERMEGLFDDAIVGAGDHIMKNSFIGTQMKNFNDYKNIPGLYRKIVEFYDRVSNFKCWFVNGIIVHNYHGEKKNRMYDRRLAILEKHDYDPDIHLDKNNCLGLSCPSNDMSIEFQSDIQDYFRTRQEST